jgi:hypothetical protein
MNPIARRIHADAVELTERELTRRRSAASSLSPAGRAAVAVEARRIADALADGLLDHARTDVALAAALTTVYGARSASRPGHESVPGTAD